MSWCGLEFTRTLYERKSISVSTKGILNVSIASVLGNIYNTLIFEILFTVCRMELARRSDAKMKK
jgi:hypothetical protein